MDTRKQSYEYSWRTDSLLIPDSVPEAQRLDLQSNATVATLFPVAIMSCLDACTSLLVTSLPPSCNYLAPLGAAIGISPRM